MRYIVVGNSAAGLFAVEEIRRHDTQSELLVLTAEQNSSYSRCLTTYFLAGDIPASRLYLRNDDFAEQLNMNIIYGVNINRVDSVRQLVQSIDGREWRYDKLLLAMGSSAKKLTIPGKNLPEVFTLRTMEDAEAINKVIERGSKKAVVVGGGLVSLKCAYALRKRGLEVIVVVSSRQILSQMLDDKAAGIIENHLRANGIQFLFQTEVITVSGKDRVQVVLLSPQTELAADLVIVGKGVCPNVGDLRHCGFNIGKGIQVDALLATNLPNIYAAGDIAETWDIVRQRFTVNATWPNAATQGRIAGANMCGVHNVYSGSLSQNSVDFFGLSAMSAGITKLNKTMGTGDWEEELAQRIIDGRTIYQKLIWQGDVLKGFILVGDTSQCGVLTALVKSGRPLTRAQKNVALGKRGTLATELIL
ncbi:FAD-dependent oxidoreductase [Desulfosporosinus sp. FKA]|uniref:NAD(P)/FAD-dependent oxidoreductase n=1 Tax=Desulfosporosinus sp. FKA TaxID=1969834 RepID=UPI000B49F634|nr:FAD-dependent oxidoreductase [Desulfosporosinus sp. FKA]